MLFGIQNRGSRRVEGKIEIISSDKDDFDITLFSRVLWFSDTLTLINTRDYNNTLRFKISTSTNSFQLLVL